MRVARVATVKRMISRAEETKYAQTFGASTQVLTGTPTMGFLAPIIQQGTTAITRIGNRITITRLNVRFMIAGNNAAASVLRIVLAVDKQPNGALPSTAGILFADSTAANWWYSGYNPTFVGPRFKILMDRSRSLEVIGGAADYGEKKVMTYTMRKPLHVTFNSNAGTIADIVKNGILLFAFTDVAASGPFVTFEATYRFKDA